jgi:hypothetical protein
MRRVAVLALISAAIACRSESPKPAGESAPAPVSSSPAVRPDSPATTNAKGAELQDNVLKYVGPGTILLDAGTYDLSRVVETDTSCATCLGDEVKSVQPVFTRGLRVSGKGIIVRGAGAERTLLSTGAGVGVLFDGCDDCTLEGVTVTGGERDTDRRALDAAVVVRNGHVTLKQCVLKDNLGKDDVVLRTVVGICGVAVREGGVARIEGCRIERNSWDGIAVLRGASAVIEGNLVDGVDRAPMQSVGGGRTTGVDVAWDGEATLHGNLIRRSDTGVSMSGDAKVVMSENVVEDVGSFAVGVRSGDVGRPSVDIEANAFFRVAGCGIVVRAPAPLGGDVLRIVDNAFALTGVSGVAGACMPTAIDAPSQATISGNAFHANKEIGGTPGRNDVDTESWNRAVTPLLVRLHAWPVLADSQFVQAFHAAPSR